MMKILIKKVVLVLMFVFSALGFEQLTLADSNDFSVTPVLTENQNPEVSSYFDLTVTPNQKQTLKIKIKNNSNESVKYKLYVNTATTNQNGIIDYSINDFEKDESLKLSLKECLTLKEQYVDVPAHSEKEVSLELSVPETPFEGIALGGITVEPTIKKEADGVNNVVTRTLAIQLAETAKEITPKLEGGKVIISQENLRNNVKFELRNITPTIISKVRADIAITKKGSETTILKQTKDRLSFAPNSKFSLMTEWDKQFDSGQYTYIINLTDEKGNRWSFAKNFEIKEELAEKLNKTSVDRKESFFEKYYILFLVLLSILFIVFALFMLNRYFKKTDDKGRK
ncbi:DUF916 and DUF3324 domain-containing protein [Enterococcus faecalis]|uniref:DUF916 and DUF3324 domain-containing protein n=1 Tax=Enterococcus faecalis TaxID=1351 RepID=UPI003CC52F1E